MRVATFNLESLEPKSRDGVLLEQRAEILRPQLERLRADVLCLQEVNGQRRAAGGREPAALCALLAGTVYEHFHLAISSGPVGTGVADVHNLAIVSRFPVLKVRDIRNDNVPAIPWHYLTAMPPSIDPVSVNFDRPILAATIDIGRERPLEVFNVHFRAPLAAVIPGQKESAFVWKSVRGWAEGYYLSALRRTGQALELRLAVETVLDEDPHANVVVCGDFNAEDHETPLKIVVAGEEDTGSGLLASRSLPILDRTIAEDRRFSVLHHGRPQMLDHIVASRTMLARFRAAEVHNETLSDELVSYTRIQHPTGSHHAPLVAEFEW